MLKKWLLGSLSLFSSFSIWAAEPVYDPNLPLEWASIITLSAGPTWAWPGQSQFLYLGNPALPYYFDAQEKTNLIGTGEIFFGLQRAVSRNIIGQLGLGVAVASDVENSGYVNSEDILAINTYQYKVSHARVEMKGKLIAAAVPFLQPYLSASAGIAFNRAHNYRSVSINEDIYPIFGFERNSEVGFAYSAGVGVQKMLNPYWQVGVGYEFADWGKNYLSANNFGKTVGLGSAYLYTNELLISISYLY